MLGADPRGKIQISDNQENIQRVLALLVAALKEGIRISQHLASYACDTIEQFWVVS